MRKARSSGNWDPVLAGLTLFGMDFFNETWNGWVLAISGRSAFWTAPGDTTLRTMVGWNIEIMLMFAIAGIVFFYMCPEDRSERIHGLPARWFWAIAFSAFCVLVECVLNIGGRQPRDGERVRVCRHGVEVLGSPIDPSSAGGGSPVY